MDTYLYIYLNSVSDIYLYTNRYIDITYREIRSMSGISGKLTTAHRKYTHFKNSPEVDVSIIDNSFIQKIL